MDQGKILDQQRAYARRAAEFMRADRDHVGIGEGKLARALGAVREEEDALTVERVERLDDAGLIVDVLDGEDGLAPFIPVPAGKTKKPIRVHLQPLGMRGDAQDRIMLHRRGQDSVRLDAAERDGDRFARAGGEDDLPAPSQRGTDAPPRILQRGTGGAAVAMRAGWIGPVRQRLDHHCPRLGQDRRGGGMIQIETVGSHGSGKTH